MKKSFAILLGLTLCLAFALPAGAEDIAAEQAVPDETAENDYAVGNIVTFGDYEQDNDVGNGEEPIEWIVLAVDGDQALLISRYCLDAHVYHKTEKKITWCKCSLRLWLNYTFINVAFTVREQEKIVPTTIVNDGNPDYDSYGCEDTTDRIFLLSYDEALSYFPDPEERVAQATAYAVANGAYVDEENGNAWWWLRTAGYDNSNAFGVRSDGRVSGYGSREVNRASGGARPVIWLYIGD